MDCHVVATDCDPNQFCKAPCLQLCNTSMTISHMGLIAKGRASRQQQRCARALSKRDIPVLLPKHYIHIGGATIDRHPQSMQHSFIWLSGRKTAHKHKLCALVNVQMALGQTAGCSRVSRAKKFMCSLRNTGNIKCSLWLTGGLSQGCPDFQKVYVFKVYLPFSCPRLSPPASQEKNPGLICQIARGPLDTKSFQTWHKFDMCRTVRKCKS